jgi:hypothetical protein
MASNDEDGIAIEEQEQELLPVSCNFRTHFLMIFLLTSRLDQAPKLVAAQIEGWTKALANAAVIVSTT